VAAEVGDTIRLFCGCAPNGDDAESMAVLEYTARKHTTGPLEITWMMQSRKPRSPWFGWNTANWITPFSGLRWGIPAACKYRGRAIYMDSDMIVLGDLRELWEKPIPKPAFALARVSDSKLRTCVMLIDCKRAKAVLPDLATLKAAKNQRSLVYKMIRERPEILAEIGAGWNSIDLAGTDLDDHALRILHYSEMSTQPHLEFARRRMGARGLRHWYDGPIREHPRPEIGRLFWRLMAKAIAAGYPVSRYQPRIPFGAIEKRSLKDRPLKHFR